ncbi:MAG TPA: hypothetical protein VD903_23565 [Pseudonocardia sp.]|nr:hypothetical protein [Pseudonocardia sp.]
MTDPRQPSVDLLADLDAGLLDPTTAARVRAAAARDPRAAAVLDGLAATRADLGALADPPVPGHVAARWDAALAAEARPPEGAPPGAARGTAAGTGARAGPGGGAVTGIRGPDDHERALRGGPPHGAPRGVRPDGVPHPGRAWRSRQQRRRPVPRRLRPALVATAVLAAAVVGGVLAAPPEPAPLSLDGVDLATAGLSVRGDFDVGELADPARRSGCLRAVAPPEVAPDAPLLGGRDVVLDGRPGVLLLLATGRLGHLHVVVVAPGCGPEGGTLLQAQTIGR